MGSIHFEIHGQDFGEGEYYGRGHGGPFHSIAFFCPECGQIWARLKSDFHTNWRWTGQTCENHSQKYPFEVPGTLDMRWEPQIEEAMPRAVLLRQWRLYDAARPITTFPSLNEVPTARSECDAPGSLGGGQDVLTENADC